MTKKTKIAVGVGVGVLVVAALCCGVVYAFGGDDSDGGRHRAPGRTTKTTAPKAKDTKKVNPAVRKK